MKKLIIATRGSQLALWQARYVQDRLEREHGLPVELKIIKTRGDIILDVPLARVGGKGLFVKDIEEALLTGEADLAVLSMKDVPMSLPAGLTLGAVPEREDPVDLLLSTQYESLDALPEGARVGTCSLRRQAQILSLRPDLRVENLRGNVDTRLRKLHEGQYDAIVMAASGMKRLGLSAPCMFRLEPPAFLPAVGQGALGVECRADRQDVLDVLAFLEHRPTRVCVEAERGFSAGVGGGCQAPVAGFATLDGDTLSLDALVASLDGKRVIRLSRTADADSPRELGMALASGVLAAGGDTLLADILTTGQENA